MVEQMVEMKVEQRGMTLEILMVEKMAVKLEFWMADHLAF